MTRSRAGGSSVGCTGVASNDNAQTNKNHISGSADRAHTPQPLAPPITSQPNAHF